MKAIVMINRFSVLLSAESRGTKARCFFCINLFTVRKLPQLPTRIFVGLPDSVEDHFEYRTGSVTSISGFFVADQLYLIFIQFSCSILYRDRKSTRLNSSHVKISYAVFCLKKKKNNKKS